MPLRSICDWCSAEEVPKIRKPGMLVLPVGWSYVPMDNRSTADVIVACGPACKALLEDTAAEITKAKKERDILEDRKRRRL